MKEINVAEITKTIKKLCIDANYYLSDDIRNELKKAKEEETWDIAKGILDKILINADIAKNEKMPMCQDTGMTCVFIEIGQEVHIVGGSLEEAINSGVAQGYEEGYLRKSVVKDPIKQSKYKR